jgi:GNAT superfamily N-acetyltransferase
MPDENEITLRYATSNDLPALHNLIAASVRGLCIQDYPAEFLERALGSALGVDERLVADGTYYVAEVSGVTVGCGGWSYRRLLYGAASATEGGAPGESNLLDPTHEAARIRAFFVHPAWSRRGIGRRILEASEQAAIAAGFRRLELVATRTGEPLYRACGYTLIGYVPLTVADGESVPGAHMGKEIA